MQPQTNILLIVTGHTTEPVRAQFGECQDLFKKSLGSQINVTSHLIFENWEHLPKVTDFDGVIMSGSSAMLDEDRDWMRAAKKLTKDCLENGTPFFGVCFGHQVLGSVCGARVGPNPNGRANGSTCVNVTNKVKIFQDMPPSFHAQISHRDVILDNRSDFEIIAEASHDSRHAIMVGVSAFGVQFHPEWDIDISRGYIGARSNLLGEAGVKEKLASLKESPLAKKTMQQFVDCCGKKSWQPNP